jgi:hypothetical protein
MGQLSSLQIEMKIAPPETYFLIGSQTIDGVYQAPVVELNSIANVENQRKKRLLDISFSILTLPFFWVWFFRYRFQLLHWSFQVLLFNKTWVSYNNQTMALPTIPQGFFTPSADSSILQDAQRADMLYAKDYHWTKDVQLIWRQLF